MIVAGNHDHALVEPWLARRGERARAGSRSASSRLLEPAQVSPVLERIAEWAAPARVRVAYPGLWVRPDVYATHGHYLDCHLTVPTLERLSVGAMSRVLGRPASAFDCVADYEATVAPVFAWRDAVARDARTGAALNGGGHGDARGTRSRWQRGAGCAATRRLGRCDCVRAAHRGGLPARRRRRSTVPGIGPLRADISS